MARTKPVKGSGAGKIMKKITSDKPRAPVVTKPRAPAANKPTERAVTRTGGKRAAAGRDGEGAPPTESRTVGGDCGLNILERLAAAAVPCADFVEAPLEASSLQAWRSSSFQAPVSSSRRRWRSSSVFLPSRLPPHAFSLPLTVLLARSRSPLGCISTWHLQTCDGSRSNPPQTLPLQARRLAPALK